MSAKRWAAALLLAATPALAAPTISTLHGTKPVAADDVESALASNRVIVHLAAGESLPLYDLKLRATEPTTAMIALSSEYLTVAVLSGHLQADGGDAKAGQAMIWSHSGTMHAPLVKSFAARELSGRLRQDADVDPTVKKTVDQLANDQQMRRTWGLLKTSTVNVGMPMQPAAETLRRAYLDQPQVVSAQRDTMTPISLSNDVARRAVEALRAGHADELAQLLTPAFFRNAAVDGKLGDARLGMAKDLVNTPWAKDSDPATLKRISLSSSSARYRFAAGQKMLTIDVAGFDAAMFVSRINDLTATTQP